MYLFKIFRIGYEKGCLGGATAAQVGIFCFEYMAIHAVLNGILRELHNIFYECEQCHVILILNIIFYPQWHEGELATQCEPIIIFVLQLKIRYISRNKKLIGIRFWSLC